MKMDNINQKLTEWHEETEQTETDYIQDSRFIHHIHNYTEYNQQWNVSQVLYMDSAIICNINTRECI